MHNRGFFWYKTWGHVTIIGCILLVSFLLDRILNTAIMLTCYSILRTRRDSSAVFGVTWHSGKDKECKALTKLMMSGAIGLLLPTSLSALVVVPMAFVINFALWRAGLNKAKTKELKRKCYFSKKQIRELEKEIEELRLRLEPLEIRYAGDFRKYGLSKMMSDFAYDLKVGGLTRKELMIKHNIGEEVVKKRVGRINKALRENGVYEQFAYTPAKAH